MANGASHEEMEDKIDGIECNYDNMDKESILSHLSPQLWAHILCKLPLPNILGIGSTSKSVRMQVDNPTTWAHLFGKEFPQVRIKADDEAIHWKDIYKKYYKQLLHPLSIKISISHTQLKYGDTVELTLNIINFSEKTINIY